MVQKKKKVLSVQEALKPTEEQPKSFQLKGKKIHAATRRYWFGLKEEAPMRKVQVGPVVFLKNWVKRSGPMGAGKELWMQGYVTDLTTEQVQQVDELLEYAYFHVENKVDAKAVKDEFVPQGSEDLGPLDEIKCRIYHPRAKLPAPLADFPNDDDLPVLPFVYFREVDPSVQFFPMGTPTPDALAPMEIIDAL